MNLNTIQVRQMLTRQDAKADKKYREEYTEIMIFK